MIAQLRLLIRAGWSLWAAATVPLACGAAPDVVHVGAPKTVAEPGASNPTLAVDGSGRRYLAWVGYDGEVPNVYLAVAQDGSDTFGAPVRVNDLPGDAAAHEQAPPQVVVDRSGRVYVVWQNQIPRPGHRWPGSDLRVAVSSDGGRSFAPAVTVNDDAGGPPSSHTFHDVAVAPDGTVFVSWIDSRERDRVAGTLPDNGAGHEEQLPGPEIRVARSRDGGGSFGASLIVDRSSCPCCRTSIAASGDGTVYVAWRRVFPGDIRDVVVARLDPGADEFTPPMRVHADDWVFGGCPHTGPSLAVDAANRLHVAWYTGREGRQGIWHAVSRNRARSFGAPTPLLHADWVPPSVVRLQPAPDGGVWAAWDDRRHNPPLLHLARLAGGDTGQPVTFMQAQAPGKAPVLGVGASDLLVAWLDGESVRVRRVEGTHVAD